MKIKASMITVHEYSRATEVTNARALLRHGMADAGGIVHTVFYKQRIVMEPVQLPSSIEIIARKRDNFGLIDPIRQIA